MLKILQNKQGMSHVKTAAIIIIISMLFSIMLSYTFLMSTVSRARDDTQRVLDGFCIEKSIEIYGSIKNGNKQMVKGTYTTEFMTRLVSELGLTGTGNAAYHASGSNIIFRYDNPLTANLHSDTLSLTMEFDIVIPVGFAGRNLFEMKIPMRTESIFVLKGN
jgi:hypothetical protein